jgi:hypothetical protein
MKGSKKCPCKGYNTIEVDTVKDDTVKDDTVEHATK